AAGRAGFASPAAPRPRGSRTTWTRALRAPCRASADPLAAAQALAPVGPDAVAAGAAHDRVTLAVAGFDAVPARPTMDYVAAAPCADPVAAGAGVDAVVSAPADQVVVAATAGQDIVA